MSGNMVRDDQVAKRLVKEYIGEVGDGHFGVAEQQFADRIAAELARARREGGGTPSPLPRGRR